MRRIPVIAKKHFTVRWVLLCGVMLAANFAETQTPSPALLIVIKNDNALAIVDPGNKKVVGRVLVGNDPHEVVASSDGKLAFVSNYGARDREANWSKTISVIDLAAQKELRQVEVGPLPHGLYYLDGKLYFTAQGYKLIGRYDPAIDQIDWRMGTGQDRTHMLIFSKDRNKIFTSNTGSDTISVFERTGTPPDWHQTVIPVGKAPEAIDISPDGKEVWTGHGGDCCVSIIDAQSNKVLQTLDVQAKRINRLKFTLDGKRVFITDPGSEAVIVVDAAGRKPIKRLNLGRSPEGILMPPDGLHAYVAVAGDNNIAVVDLKTLELTDRIPTGREPDGMAWVEERR